MNILRSFPEEKNLLSWYRSFQPKPVYKVNAHIHTPYSFSSFENIEQSFIMATEENIKVLGINDFYVTNGYDSFYRNAIKYKVFPLFNIELIGLIKEAQANNVRINDLNNPGRIYFTGKGLRYPFGVDDSYKKIIDDLVQESQIHVKAMINKSNSWFSKTGIEITLDYDHIKSSFAKDLVRERHIAKAIRVSVFEKFPEKYQRIKAFERLFNGQVLKSNIIDIAGIENEIRTNLLKINGKAYVKENESSFPDIELLIKIILNSGGIPCYPVLLDDNKGNFTEYESDFHQLYNALRKLNIFCVELIPARNNYDCAKSFVKFFNEKGFIILFGTEHNTPGIFPLTVFNNKKEPLSNEFEALSFENACIIAAHQYFTAREVEGYVTKDGSARISERKYFAELGKAVIQWFIEKEL